MIQLITDGTSGVPSQPQQPGMPQQPETPEQTGTGLLANGQEATVENVQPILDEIKMEYPEGTSWGDRNTEGTNSYKDGPSATEKTRDLGVMNANYKISGTNIPSSLRDGCGGFMAMVSERIFGKTGALCCQVTCADQIRPGDIMVHLDGNSKASHYAICLGAT